MIQKQQNKSFRYPASNRIKRRADFVFVQGNGRKIRSSYFIIAYLRREFSQQSSITNLKSDKSLPSRFGITVTTKVDKRAVSRNRLKRSIREFLRKNKSQLRYPVDMVIIAQRESVSLSTKEIWAELENLLKRGKLL